MPRVRAPTHASTYTETRTVVKTKSKKLPIFLASFAGLVVGAVLVIAGLVTSGAFRITDSNVEIAAPPAPRRRSTSTPRTPRYPRPWRQRRCPPSCSSPPRARMGELRRYRQWRYFGHRRQYPHEPSRRPGCDRARGEHRRRQQRPGRSRRWGPVQRPAGIRLKHPNSVKPPPSRSAIPTTSRWASGSWPLAAPSATSSPCPRVSSPRSTVPPPCRARAVRPSTRT